MSTAYEGTYPALERLTLAQLDAVLAVVGEAIVAGKAIRKEDIKNILQPHPLKAAQAGREVERHAVKRVKTLQPFLTASKKRTRPYRPCESGGKTTNQ